MQPGVRPREDGDAGRRRPGGESGAVPLARGGDEDLVLDPPVLLLLLLWTLRVPQGATSWTKRSATPLAVLTQPAAARLLESLLPA